MKRFFGAGDDAWSALKQRAQRHCVTFSDVELPPGSDPSRSRVGFEIGSSGNALLLVDQVRTAAGDEDVTRWLTSGTRRFDTFDELRDWVDHTLASAYGDDVASSDSPGSTEPPACEDLSDFDAVDLPSQAGQLVHPEALARTIRRTIRGQDEAVRVMANAVCRHLRRKNPRKPPSLFAVGPTGVGKTQAAIALAEALSELSPATQYSFLRLDMNEYAEEHRVSQLLGAPQGYVGYADGAQLVDKLRANPCTVVLFDEIEKAHPRIFTALMNMMDAGRLSTPSGRGAEREIDCRKAILLFTSNLDCADIISALERDGALDQPRAWDAQCRAHFLKGSLAPELIGRITAFLVFGPISGRARAEILALAVRRIAREYGVEVRRIEPSVLTELLKKSGDGRFGARPDEYLVDQVLGDVFQSAGEETDSRPKVLIGPPFSLRDTARN